MARIEDLKEVLKETLENKGVLNQVRARIRAEVYNALDEQNEVKPTLSNENFLINELIREYLDFNKYNYTKSVLTAESGQPPEKIDRRLLLQQLNMEETQEEAKLPLIYWMLSHFLRGQQKVKFEPNIKDGSSTRKYFPSVPERQREAADSENSVIEGTSHKKGESLITYKN